MALRVHAQEITHTVGDERHLDFIAGFPCTQFTCRGVLTKTDHRGQPVIACADCGRIYR